MSDLEAAVAAGVIGADEAHRSLLQATVEVARAIFRAKASSVFLLDEDAEELVFEAVAGEGQGELIGMRFPAGNGIAGWVLTTRQPLVVEDLSADTRWSRTQAESTGYVPTNMMSVPLLVEERALGVPRSRSTCCNARGARGRHSRARDGSRLLRASPPGSMKESATRRSSCFARSSASSTKRPANRGRRQASARPRRFRRPRASARGP